MPRRPKPTKLRILAGNPGKRALNPNEPEPESTAKCPSWLEGDALAEWKRLAPELESLGLLSNLDSAALVCYCESYERWRQAQAQLKLGGLVLVASNGSQYPSPWVAISNTAMDKMRSFLIEFGMTPSARSKVTVTPKHERNEWDDFMAGLSREPDHLT